MGFRGCFLRLLMSFAFAYIFSSALFFVEGGPLIPNEASLMQGISPSALELRVEERMTFIPFFNSLKSHARSMGLRVWLLGGAASSLATYARWDLLRESGDSNFRSRVSTYDWTHIFRSDQDIDIVIDGNEDAADHLLGLMIRDHPKIHLDAFTLRGFFHGKAGVLEPHFYNQHGDSFSFGLLEISDPQNGESRFRDVKNWNSATSQFLKDSAKGIIRFDKSLLHHETSRAARGLNPPIISVIRYLIKVLSYGLTVDVDDVPEIFDLIDDYRLSLANWQPLQKEYFSRWKKKHLMKLFSRSIDIQRSFDLLHYFFGENLVKELFGSSIPLRKVVSRKPVRKILSEFSVKNPEKVYSHDTMSFSAYEQITASPTFRPNLLISREGVRGENAAFGDGFYVWKGRHGFWESPHRIHFHIDLLESPHDAVFSGPWGILVLRDGAKVRIVDQDDRNYRRKYFFPSFRNSLEWFRQKRIDPGAFASFAIAMTFIATLALSSVGASNNSAVDQYLEKHGSAPSHNTRVMTNQQPLEISKVPSAIWLPPLPDTMTFNPGPKLCDKSLRLLQ